MGLPLLPLISSPMHKLNPLLRSNWASRVSAIASGYGQG